MAIYTKISKKDVVSIERKFNLGKITSFKGIKKGIEKRKVENDGDDGDRL